MVLFPAMRIYRGFPFFFVLLFAVGVSEIAAQGKMIYKGDTVNEFDASGEKHGKWVQTFQGSKDIKFIGNFHHGTPRDTFRYYYRDGTLKALNIFGPEGKRSKVRTYHPSGKLMAKGRYIDKKKDSVWAYYDGEGVLSAVQEFEEGTRNGKGIVFYRDGDTARIRHYKDSVLHGPWKQYYSNGKLEAKGRFEEGRRAGTLERYYPNGQLKFKGQHDEKGFRTGEWTWYEKNGKVERYVIYEQGNVKKVLSPEGEVIQKGEAADTIKAVKKGKKEREGPRLKRGDRPFEKERSGKGRRGP